MKSKLLVVMVLLVGVAVAKDKQVFYQKGQLVEMRSVQCGYDENSGKSVLGEIVGTDSAHRKTREMMCPEYVLRTDKVDYRIRPREEKHPVLLPVGENAEFRIKHDRMVLRVIELDGKDREYNVIEMTPRTDSKVAQK